MTSHSDPAAFQATYSNWRVVLGRKVIQLVFEIPLEHGNLAYSVLGGMPNPAAEVWCGIARMPQAKTVDVTVFPDDGRPF